MQSEGVVGICQPFVRVGPVYRTVEKHKETMEEIPEAIEAPQPKKHVPSGEVAS